MADLYIQLYNTIIHNSATAHGREGYYNVENGEEVYYKIGEAIAKSMVELGKSQNPKPVALTGQQFEEYSGIVSLVAICSLFIPLNSKFP